MKYEKCFTGISQLKSFDQICYITAFEIVLLYCYGRVTLNKHMLHQFHM